MAYIFKNNKELNNYVCEIENLRIISWINYNYYDDGDVYSFQSLFYWISFFYKNRKCR